MNITRIDIMIMEQQIKGSETSESNHQSETPQGEYITHINELISQPASDNIYQVATQYIISSLYELSSYLFNKKIVGGGVGGSESNFESYLTEMGQQLGLLGRWRAKENNFLREVINIDGQLVKCYQKVERIYFEEKYFLDFSYFDLVHSQSRNSNRQDMSKVNKQLDILVDELDIVEINLFSQIHCKFQEYFAVAANFDYLQDSVAEQLKKLSQSRSRIQKVKRQIVDKSVNLRKKILQRQNIEKTLKTIKIMKSIKKLPQVMQSILASSLPYDCLELLQQTKNSLESVKELKCMSHTSDSIRSMQALAQNDLTKRYSNELYLYLEECHLVNLQQIWRKVQVKTCLDKDNSVIIDELNSSTSSVQSQNQIILDNIELLDQPMNGKMGVKSGLMRQEQKQYQIAMILLQSYKYVNFTPEVIKIKVGNALRRFSKNFQKELLLYLNKMVKLQISNRKQNERILEDFDKQQNGIQKQLKSPQKQKEKVQLAKKDSGQQQEVSQKVVEKVTVQFYTTHLSVLNDIFRDTIIRFLGYLQTLITEYEDQLILKGSSNHHKLAQFHKRFKFIFNEECSLLPSIFKIVEEKIKYLLTLKNIRNIHSSMFYQWISLLKYWQRFFDFLADQHSFAKFSPKENDISKPYVTQLVDIVSQNIKRGITTMNLKTLLLDLTIDYINAFHQNTLQSEIINTLQEDTWQSTQVPQQFSEILNNILNPDGTILNASITILDSSTSSNKGNLSRDSIKDKQNSRDIKDESKIRVKFKLLKNNILVGGVRYKVNLSLIILCETLAEYVKMNRILSGVLPRQSVQQQGYNYITKYIYEKMYDMIYKFCQKSKELILETKALSFGKIKAKNINAKHICLLCNCYSILIKIGEEMLEKQKIQQFSLSNSQMNTIAFLENTHNLLTGKLSTILNSKMQKDINDFMAQEKLAANYAALSNKTNGSIITAFLQMVEITDEYLQTEDIKKVLRAGFQTLSQKYFTHLLLKGEKHRAEVELLAQKLKFLKKYFVLQYQALLQQIPGNNM